MYFKKKKLKKQDEIKNLTNEVQILKRSISRITTNENDKNVLELQNKINEWEELIEETRKLEKEYVSLNMELKRMKQQAIDSIYGNTIRYKIVSWLLR